ncbi:hypothetical protein [Eikenella halliae]
MPQNKRLPETSALPHKSNNPVSPRNHRTQQHTQQHSRQSGAAAPRRSGQ